MPKKQDKNIKPVTSKMFYKQQYFELIHELTEHRLFYALLLFVLIVAFFLRIYRVSDLMGFYYDQGRDALVMWRLWNEGKFFLIGPITGLTGIFLGPFYYYLIAPFYFLGGGNPIYPAVFLSFLSVIALVVVYYLGKEMHSRVAGFLAVLLGSFSYYLVLAGRWLSNPTPILLTSVLLLLALWKIANKSREDTKYWWPFLALLVGVSMHFESASAIFYIPVVIVFALWQWKKIPHFPGLLVSFAVFVGTLVPQILFNIRHDNLLFNNFAKLFIEEKGFSLDYWNVLDTRLNYFWDVFASKIYHSAHPYRYFFTLTAGASLLYFRKSLTSSNVLWLFLIFLGVPMVGYTLFQGNYGNIYDYYMTGYYLPMMLLFALGLGTLWKQNWGKIFVIIFLYYFLQPNLELNKNYLLAKVDGPTDVRLGNEKQSVHWIFDDALSNCLPGIGGVSTLDRGQPTILCDNWENLEYNVDVYVPPVIPHTYEYLLLWIGTSRCGKNLCGLVTDKQVETIYVLYEVDPPHPERLQAFLDRYKTNTQVQKQMKFGGITVERRIRI